MASASSNVRAGLWGSMTFYRCPTCRQDQLRGERNDIVKTLYQRNLVSWVNQTQAKVLVNGRDCLPKEPGDYRIKFEGREVTITRLGDDTPSWARVIHEKCRPVTLR